MVKRLLCFLLTVQLVLLAGCTTELYDRMLIHAIGVDTIEGGVEVTVRISQTGKEDREESLTGRGESVYRALESIKLQTGKIPLYSHNYLVIFGRACCEAGLNDVLDFFIRHFESRPSVRVFMAETTAKEVLSVAKNNELISSDTIEGMVEENVSGGSAVKMRLIDLINGQSGPTGAAVLPMLAAREEVVELTDTAVLLNGTLQTTLRPAETGGFLAITGRLSGASYVLRDEKNAQVSLRIGDMKAELHPAGSGISVRIFMEADVAAYDGLPDDARRSTAALSAALAQTVEEQVQRVLLKALRENDCDIFGFSARLGRAVPADLPVQVEVTARVNHVGSELAPLL